MLANIVQTQGPNGALTTRSRRSNYLGSRPASDCYLLISGAAVPTQRAFVMNGLVFGAIIIDRLRISMRVCAIAAAIVLAMDPSVLVGVSFQMSFGAVVALIAVYEAYGTRLGRLLHGRSLPGQVLGYCGGVVVTTVVVTLGT